MWIQAGFIYKHLMLNERYSARELLVEVGESPRHYWAENEVQV